MTVGWRLPSCRAKIVSCSSHRTHPVEREKLRRTTGVKDRGFSFSIPSMHHPPFPESPNSRTPNHLLWPRDSFLFLCTDLSLHPREKMEHKGKWTGQDQETYPRNRHRERVHSMEEPGFRASFPHLSLLPQRGESLVTADIP